MAKTASSTEYHTPRSADRILRIMELLATEEEGLPLAVICREIDTPKSSVLNLMRALLQNGYVDHGDAGYRLSASSFALAAAIMSRRHYPEVAIPILRQLADETGESAMISEIAPSGDEFIYIAKAESRQALRFATTVGDRRPLYCTASGLVLLSRLPEGDLAGYLDRTTFEPLTPRTLRTRSEVEAAVATARKVGYARTNGESSPGLSAIAAPVTGSGGHLSAVVIGGPSERIDAGEAEFIRATKAAAQRMSEIMGGPRPI